MKLEAQPWTADFRTTAATDSFPSFLGSEVWVSLIDWLWRFLSLLGWVGMFLHVLSCRPPVLSGGAGLGTLAALLWPRTCFLSFGPGLGWFLRFFVRPTPPAQCWAMVWVIGPLSCTELYVFRVRFFSALPTPPLGAGGILGNFATPTVALHYVIFLIVGGINSPRLPSLRWWRYFGFSLFRRHVFAPPSPCQVTWRWFSVTFFSRFRIGLRSFPCCLTFVVSFVASPFRGVGVGFEDPHLRRMF